MHGPAGLDPQFEDDAVTTILGPSGTGKRVPIEHPVELLEPDDGEVLFRDGALFGSINVYDNTAFRCASAPTGSRTRSARS